MDEVAARELIAEHLAVSVGLVVDDATFQGLGADSLDLVTLTVELEERFDIRIPDEAVDECATVSDALRLLRASFASMHGELEPAR